LGSILQGLWVFGELELLVKTEKNQLYTISTNWNDEKLRN
jgi:hypothetical protein